MREANDPKVCGRVETAAAAMVQALRECSWMDTDLPGSFITVTPYLGVSIRQEFGSTTVSFDSNAFSDHGMSTRMKGLWERAKLSARSEAPDGTRLAGWVTPNGFVHYSHTHMAEASWEPVFSKVEES